MVAIGRKQASFGFLGRTPCLVLYAVFVTIVLEEQMYLNCLRDVSGSTPTQRQHSETSKTTSSAVTTTTTSTTTTSSNTRQGIYTPVDCQSFVKRVSVDTDPEGREKVLIRTATSQSFLLSLHLKQHDRVRWDIVEYGRYYERALEDVWTRVLRSAPAASHVVDVGGNVGYYSLFSASLGDFTVDAFEPNPPNILRFCESIGVNHWGMTDRLPFVQVWEMGISSEKGELKFAPDVANPGGGKIVSGNEVAPGMVKIPVTTLDDFAQDRGWFQDPPNIAILKIDVERHESQVLEGARRLLQSGFVQNVFTEVGSEGGEDQIAGLQMLLDAGYHLAGHGNFRGPNKKSIWPHDDDLPANILKHLDSKGDQHPFLNLWWSLDRTATV